MSGYVDISQAGVALGQNSTKYVSLSSSASGALTLQGATSSDTVRLSGLAAPTQASDAVTKAHMETYIASAVGGMSVKEDCIVAATSQTPLQLVSSVVQWGPFAALSGTKSLASLASAGAAYPATPFASDFTVVCELPNLNGLPAGVDNDYGHIEFSNFSVALNQRSSDFFMQLDVGPFNKSGGGSAYIRKFWDLANITKSAKTYLIISATTASGVTQLEMNLYDASYVAIPSTNGTNASNTQPQYWSLTNWVNPTGTKLDIRTGQSGTNGDIGLQYTKVMFFSSQKTVSQAVAAAGQAASGIIDGVTLTSGMRVLLTGQTDAKDNGIYSVGASSLARTSDLAVGALASGAFCFVTGGSANGHKGFVCNALPGAETVGTHTLQWTVFTSEDGKVGTTTIAGGVITDASGAISLVNNSLTTSGQITAGSQHVGTLRLASGTVYDTSGALSLGSTSVTTSGSVTAASLTAASHVAGTLSLAAASLTDSSGSISMSSTNLATSGNMSAAHFTSSSDERLKSDIKPLATSLEDLQKVRGVSFKWVSTESADTGVIAQEIQMLAPECVHQDERSGYLQVDYARLVPYLIEWIRQLAARSA